MDKTAYYFQMQLKMLLVIVLASFFSHIHARIAQQTPLNERLKVACIAENIKVRAISIF